MKKILLPFCFLMITIVGSIFSQTYSFDPEIITERITKDITVLAHDSLQGRGSGIKGENRTSRYISSKFREIGLEPLQGEDSYSLPFEFCTHKYPASSSLKINDQSFHMKNNFFPLSNSPDCQLSGEMIFAGFGIVAPELNYSDYKENVNYKNKILMIETSIPGGYSKKSPFLKYMDIQKKIEQAVSKGAKAVIFVNSDNKAPDISQSKTVMVGHAEKIPLLFFLNDPSAFEKSDMNHAEIIISHNLTYENFINIAGYINNHANETVVIGAHYDHLGTKSKIKKKVKRVYVYNGADDNASGTAGMIELARFVKGSGLKGKNYLFIAFSGEEKGLLGSSDFVKSGIFKKLHITAMINLDMVGRLDSRQKLFVYGTRTSTEWNSLLKKAPHPHLRVRKFRGSSIGSDNQSFYKKKVPVLFFNTGLHPDYHKPCDEAKYINFKGEESIVAYIGQVIRELDQLPPLHFRKVSGFAGDFLLVLQEFKFM